MTREPTDAQLLALARIKFWGVEVLGGDPASPMAMAFVCAPHYSTSVQLKITTMRALMRRGWVSQLPAEADELGRENIWGITRAGVDLLNAHPSFLEAAGREASSMAGNSVIQEVLRGQRQSATSATATGSAQDP